MDFALSLAWRLLLAVALVANPLIGIGGNANAKAPALATSAACPEMAMATAAEPAKPAAQAAQAAQAHGHCHERGCPDSLCGSACDMGACVGHCAFILGGTALPVWRGADVQFAATLVRDAQPPLLAPLIRPPIA
jgi:hypothetical protein